MDRSDVYFSAYTRREDDNYPTIDTRCLDGLLFYAPVAGRIVDPCARAGSALAEQFLERGYQNVFMLNDAYMSAPGDWIVTNPPFTKSEVTKIVERQIKRVENENYIGFALLVRNNWAFAKSRRFLFNRPTYSGEIKLLFRPFWTDDRSMEPKHNYVWHIWQKDGWAHKINGFYLPPYDERYVVRKLENKPD